jgi:TPP-dependent pyruvate/acetoin dehydrogenase alpha subunit
VEGAAPSVPPLGAGVHAPPDLPTLAGIWRTMLLARTFEERVIALYRQNRVTGGVYTGIGNEATSVATAWPMAPEDVLLPLHRDLGAHFARGHTPREVMAQVLKRAVSQTGGKDTGLHLGRPGANIVGMISHLGHMIPVAAGVALAERYQGRRAVAVTYIGDGGTSTGDFHEALNFAAVQKLPMICVVENNQWAYSTPNELEFACARLSDRAAGYGMAGETVDGTDAIAVYDAAARALERARAGRGPTLLETITFRMRGHAEHDDMKYVPAEMIAHWSPRDPLERLERHLRAVGGLDGDEAGAARSEAAAAVDDAVTWAEAQPSPKGPEAAEGVYAHWEPRWNPPRGGGGGA